MKRADGETIQAERSAGVRNFSSSAGESQRLTAGFRVKVAAALAESPSGTLPSALPQWSELKAAYRLFDNPTVTFEKILEPHFRKVQATCVTAGQFLLIEDTTLLDYSSRKSLEGIGRIGDDGGRGINLHSTLAFRVEGWDEVDEPRLSLLGLAGQHRWIRAEELTRGEGVAPGREPKKRKFSRARESERWAKVLAEFPAAAPGNQRIYIADREGDIYEAFQRCRAAHCDFVLRACQDRALLEGEGSLFAAVGNQKELGRYTLQLRARPGTPAREATMAVRAARVVLRPPYRPGGKPSPEQLFVVEACEVDPSNPEDAICWVLLTSIDCLTYAQARRIVQLYACRWMIEEYHKALKTGAGIERSQLQECRRVEVLLGILSLVAVRLLNLKLQAAEAAELPVKAGDIEPEGLAILEARFGLPRGGWTQRTLWIWIARLGGYLARRSDGAPGWQTLWRGWNRLRAMTEGAQLMK
jgi:hypothetical protein